MVNKETNAPPLHHSAFCILHSKIAHGGVALGGIIEFLAAGAAGARALAGGWESGHKEF